MDTSCKEDSFCMKPGEIRVLTGFSSAGKTFFATKAAQANPSLLHLVEDHYYHFYMHPEVFGEAGEALLQDLTKAEDPTRLFYSCAQKALFDQAFEKAALGSPVLVDVCCGQPDDFFSLLLSSADKARKEQVPFRVDWITCDPEVRRARLLKGRQTAFDLVLGKAPSYFEAVSRIEGRLSELSEKGLDLHVRQNNFGGTNPSPPPPGLKGSKSKNIPFLADWVASEHIRLLQL